jgi:hypothetical protein
MLLSLFRVKKLILLLFFIRRTCLKNEVLTFTLGEKKISRITLGALEDLGYVVNYTAADPYGLEDIGVCRGCEIGTRRYLNGANINEDMEVVEPKMTSCHSGIVHERALRRGKEMLRDTSTHHMLQTVTVTYKHEDGTLCSTLVEADDLF